MPLVERKAPHAQGFGLPAFEAGMAVTPNFLAGL